MIYGYTRVSTDAQELGNQVAELKVCKCAIIFRESMCGATVERPRLKKLMSKLAACDVVVIPAVDCLSRDTTDLLVIAHHMQRAGVGLRAIAGPVVGTTSHLVALGPAMFGNAARLERCRIMKHTAHGCADSRPRGVKSDRNTILTPWQQRKARKRIDAIETQRRVARSYNISRATISRLSA
jgi:DNA invertase Pin-like site-specific DNA recombinase